MKTPEQRVAEANKAAMAIVREAIEKLERMFDGLGNVPEEEADVHPLVELYHNLLDSEEVFVSCAGVDEEEGA